jgi:hypothetical protein
MNIKVGLRFVVDTHMGGIVYTISQIDGSRIYITWDIDYHNGTTYEYEQVTRYLTRGDWVQVDYIKPRKISKQHKF